MIGRRDSFWDKRRAAVRAEAEAEATLTARHQAEAEQAALEQRPDAEILAELNLPDPDTLTMGSDFAAFMARGVPTRLRNRALRRLWRSNPVLACVDGLNDYDEDFLAGSTGNGVIATSYQVGKGMLRHLDEMTRQKELAEAPEATVDEPEPTAPPADADKAPAPPAPAEALAEAPPDEFPAAPPRRMRFHFDDTGAA